MDRVEEEEEATPVMVQRIGKQTTLYDQYGRKLTPEEAHSVARRMFGHKSAGSLQKGPEYLKKGEPEEEP